MCSLIYLFIFILIQTVCEQTTFIYNGRCYTSCPDHAYMLPESSNIDLNSDSATARLHERAVIPSVPQKKCAACHISCLRCRGPLKSDCTECATESIYREVAPNETYCDPGEHEVGSPQVVKLFEPSHSSNNTDQNLSHKSIVQQLIEHTTISTALIYIASVTIILFTVYIACKVCGGTSTTVNTNDKKKYAYNRIAFDGTNDQIAIEQEMMIHASDSSEETETIK